MALIADNVSLHMSGFNILRDVNIAINAGQITAIVGPNGAGKSSFIKVLSGDMLPTQGQVTLNDRALSPIGVLTKEQEWSAYCPSTAR